MQRRTILQTAIAGALNGTLVLEALAEQGGQCVKYVKRMKPGGFSWDGYYPKLKNGAPIVKSCLATDKDYQKNIKNGNCVQWGPAKDIWLALGTKSKGATPKVGSVMVFDAMKASAVGHVAIVTSVSKDNLTVSVMHSNWEGIELISAGTYVLDGKGGAKYITSKGVKWNTPYPVLGFIYEP